MRWTICTTLPNQSAAVGAVIPLRGNNANDVVCTNDAELGLGFEGLETGGVGSSSDIFLQQKITDFC